jgi:hypothetical protein
MRIYKGTEGSKDDGKIKKERVSGNKIPYIIYSHSPEFKHSGTDITDDVSGYMFKPYGVTRGTTHVNDDRMFNQNINGIEILVEREIDDYILIDFINEKVGACRNGGNPYLGACVAAAVSHARQEQKFDDKTKGIFIRSSQVLSEEGVSVYIRDWEEKAGILIDVISPSSKLREIVEDEEGVPVTKPITWSEIFYEENRKIKEEFIKQYPNLPGREEYVPKGFIKDTYAAPIEQQQPEQKPILAPMPKPQVSQPSIKQVPSLTIPGVDLMPAEEMPAPTDKL